MLLVADLSIAAIFGVAAVLILIELTGPVIAETRYGGTPWHPHHIAERYGLLVIITLGEALIGTMATLTALVGPDGPGWSVDVGPGRARRHRADLRDVVDLLHHPVAARCSAPAASARSAGATGTSRMFGAVVAVGAGLHVAALDIEGESELGTVGTLATVAIPVAVFVAGVYWMYSVLTRSRDPFHLLLLAGSAAVLVASVLLAAAGASVAWSLLVLALTPWVTVAGYELRGHRHDEAVLAEL